MKKNSKTKKMADSIYETAVALCEKRNVWFQNHTLKIAFSGDDENPCEVCEMDCLCRHDMLDLCAECERIIHRKVYLKLVTQD